MANITRCVCGRRMSKDARFCLQCDRERRDARHVEARTIVATGKCPHQIRDGKIVGGDTVVDMLSLMQQIGG